MVTLWGSSAYSSSPWPGGTWASAPWTIDLYDNIGTLVAADVLWMTASVTWTLDGPGACEVSLREDAMTTDWYSGLRRIVVNRGLTPAFGGWVTHLSREGRPDRSKAGYKAAAQGLSSILDYRVVHGDFSRQEIVTTTIAWNLIQHTQAQTNGNVGFTLGAVDGTAPARTRYFCDGDVIGDAIRELAAMDPGGFDWEIDPEGRFKAWVGGRGNPSGLTISDADALDFSIVAETSDFATYATGMGDADEPCGPALVTVVDDLATAYGRREVVVDVDSNDSDDLTDAATQEMTARRNARLQVTGSWLEERMPWAWGEVWLGDLVTVTLPAWFGGQQAMQVYQIDASLEPAHRVFVTYRLRAVESPPLLLVADSSHAHTIESPTLEVPFTPNDVVGLVAWYDFADISTLWQDAAMTNQVTADEQEILGVTDKSGNGYHLTESTNGPIYDTSQQNGFPAARFNGLTTLLANTAFFDIGDTYTVFFVLRYPATAGSYSTPLEISAGAVIDTACRFQHYGTGWNLRVLDSVGAQFAGGGMDLTDNTFHITAGLASGATGVKLIVDGSYDAASDTYTPPNPNTPNRITIGRHSQSGDWWNGHMGEIVVVDSVPEDLNQLGAYFADRWNLTWTGL